MKTPYTPEHTQMMWDKLMQFINDYISSPRKEKLIEFYETYQDRILFMPASHKKEYHNAHVSGYIDHVIRVIECALSQHEIWKQHGADTSTYTIEELVFAALNHDLGKMGDKENASYIPQTDQWRKDKLGEDYTFNSALEFVSVPDRSLFLLQSHNIQYTLNEMIAIQTHDGLYDESNKKYLTGYLPEQKPRTALPFIIHQADLMAARIEFEKEWLGKFTKTTKPEPKTKPTNSKKDSVRNKALNTVGSDNLKNLLDNL